MIDIVPNKYITYNCIENSIANVCDAYGIDHRPIFLFSWDFGYHKAEKTVGEKVHYQYSGEIGFEKYIYLSKQFLDISITLKPANVETIKEAAEVGIIQLISTDSFYCPWNLAFHKYHYPHYYLLTHSENNDKLIVIDSFSSNNIIWLDKEQLREVKEVYHIEQFPLYSTNISKLKSEFLHFITISNQRGIFELINEFASDLIQINSIEELSPQIADVSNSYIIRRLSYIANSRFNASKFMKYIGLCENHIIEMKNIYEKWESLKNLFIKILLSKKITLLKQAYENILSISQEEKMLCNNILDNERV